MILSQQPRRREGSLCTCKFTHSTWSAVAVSFLRQIRKKTPNRIVLLEAPKMQCRKSSLLSAQTCGDSNSPLTTVYPTNHSIRRTYLYRFCVLTFLYFLISFLGCKNGIKTEILALFFTFWTAPFLSPIRVMKRCPDGTF